MKRSQIILSCLAATATLLVASCSSNPATGGKNVVMGSWEGEKKTTQKHHQEIVKALGLYDDQATQEYVNLVGQKLAPASGRRRATSGTATRRCFRAGSKERAPVVARASATSTGPCRRRKARRTRESPGRSAPVR